MSHLTIYRSSAGSGKTYTLTKEYLSVVLAEPERFRNILAVTFTNKATDEMKRRIIESLYALSCGEMVQLRSDLSIDLKISEKELIGNARRALFNILHKYSFFHISTIDSFFQQIIRAFAKEAGLHLGFKLELDHEKVMDEVVDNLLIGIEEDKELAHWLTRFSEEKVDEGKAWDIRRDIRELAREIFKEEFKLLEPHLSVALEHKDFVGNFRKGLYGLMQKYEIDLIEIGQSGIDIMAENGLSADDFYQKERGIGGYFFKLANGNFKNPRQASYVAQGFNNVDKWYSKSSNNNEAIIAAYPALNNILNKAVSYFDSNEVKYMTALEVLRYLYTLGILDDILKQLQKYRNDKAAMLISDAAWLLKSVVAENDSAFIYEKAGNTYKHFFIDEFQDTSGFQWNNLKPLMLNGLSEGYNSLIVGDIKQSIYRWRGGDWNLLSEKVEKEISPYPVENEHLDNNWRSRKGIIDFNNALFKHAPALLQEQYRSEVDVITDEAIKEEVGNNAETITQAYSGAWQQSPAKEKPGGYVEVKFIGDCEPEEALNEESPEKTDMSEAELNEVINIVERLQDKNYGLKDIAILVRWAVDGKKVAARLAERKSEVQENRYRYDVISSESLYLVNSMSVRLLVLLLHYLSNPLDTIKRAALLHEYNFYLKNTSETPLHRQFAIAGRRLRHENGADLLDELLPPEFSAHKAYLTKLSLYELTEKLIDIFGLNRVQKEFTYLRSFQDTVLEYVRTETPDIISFLDWWEKKGVKKSVSAPEEQDAIRIMTIHKSKGLQFKAVILPFCRWGIDHETKKPNIIWCHSDIPPFNQISHLPLKYRSDLKQTIYSADYMREKLYAYMDNLNLLYVALTRAEDALFVMAPEPKLDKQGNYKITTVGNLLYRIVNTKENELGLEQKGDATVFTRGTLELPEAEKGKQTHPVSFTEYPIFNWRGRLSIRQHAKDFFTEQVSETSEKIQYGVLMHDVMASIKTTADIDESLAQFLFEGKITPEELNIIALQLKQILAQEPLQKWFNGNWEIKNETPILMPDGETRRPDRVLLNGKHAVIIDFKFAEVSEKHKKQIDEYGELLAAMGYDQIEKHVIYFDKNNLTTFQIVTIQ